jgi:hypothetical protein
MIVTARVGHGIAAVRFAPMILRLAANGCALCQVEGEHVLKRPQR